MNPFKLMKALFTSAPRHTPRDCMERVRSGEALLIDVREPDEWTEGVAELAVLLPLSELTPRRQPTPAAAQPQQQGGGTR